MQGTKTETGKDETIGDAQLDEIIAKLTAARS
jgi:hypothetical protein